MTDMIASLIFGVCVTISVWVGMAWFKLNEIKEVLEEIANMIDTESEDKE